MIISSTIQNYNMKNLFGFIFLEIDKIDNFQQKLFFIISNWVKLKKKFI
jgi:hypothetical protein